MSAALVPGRILLSAAWSRLLKSFCWSAEVEMGDSWSSGMGGGLGRRGEAGDVMVKMCAGSDWDVQIRDWLRNRLISTPGAGRTVVVDFQTTGTGRRRRAQVQGSRRGTRLR